MSTLYRIEGSYWEKYPVPGSPARAMAKRTLHEAFGPHAQLTLTETPARRLPTWLHLLWAATLVSISIGLLHSVL